MLIVFNAVATRAEIRGYDIGDCDDLVAQTVDFGEGTLIEAERADRLRLTMRGLSILSDQENKWNGLREGFSDVVLKLS